MLRVTMRKKGYKHKIGALQGAYCVNESRIPIEANFDWKSEKDA